MFFLHNSDRRLDLTQMNLIHDYVEKQFIDFINKFSGRSFI